jgi:hypothetical protein
MARPAEVRFVGNRATTISCNDDERVNLGVIMHGRPAGWLAVIPSHEWRTIEKKNVETLHNGRCRDMCGW